MDKRGVDKRHALRSPPPGSIVAQVFVFNRLEQIRGVHRRFFGKTHFARLFLGFILLNWRKLHVLLTTIYCVVVNYRQNDLFSITC